MTAAEEFIDESISILPKAELNQILLAKQTKANILLPIQIGTAKWQKVVAANYHSMGIQEDGSVWVWGWNRYGQLGMGDTDSRSVPTEFGGLSSVNSVVANTTAKVFPTVASETITISDEASLNAVYVYGANGSFVAKKENINSNATTLNVSALANGVYFVKVASENGESVQKFIKK